MLKFFKPDIIDVSEKPYALANQPFPYNDLASDRRFEELLYSINKIKIETDANFKNKYDDINLMQGVGDEGRDCVLYKAGVVKAVIQCKKYKSRVNPTEAIKEIMKLAMYSIHDASLIPNPDDFIYYFVVSTGFTAKATDYLNNFNEEIQKEPNLEKWFNELTKDYASLSGLSFHASKTALLNKLSKIKIKQVLPQDLDIELADKEVKKIIPLFFEVKSALDPEILEKLNSAIDKLDSIAANDQLPDENGINKKFETASLQLSNYKDHLTNLSNSHIDRNETNALVTWVRSSLKPDDPPMMLLVGEPGYGKTVILKDVYKSLVAAAIPVIAIKSDRYYASSIAELSQMMNLQHSPVDLIQKLSKTHEKIVVLIDQIDALSQSVTSRRSYIDTYNQLINDLKHIKAVRIIISIRTFDLNYDYEFSTYKSIPRTKMEKLSKEQVQPVVSRLGISINSISKDLLNLLSVPNNLDIFCKIYTPHFRISQVSTIKDLYDELWENKILNTIGAEQKGNLLYAMAEKLHQKQVLTINEKELPLHAPQDLSYLISNGIIEHYEKDISFFHQSFFDYVFSKSFVESNRNIFEYIQNENQSIYIRPAVKMILTFLRQTDLNNYLAIAKKLLSEPKIRFHLKLLLINQIGYEAHPSKEETTFVKSKILSHSRYRLPFLESAFGAGWLTVFIRDNILNELLFVKKNFKEKLPTAVQRLGLKWNNTYPERKSKLQDLWYRMVVRKLPDQRKEILHYLSTLPAFENIDKIIIRILYILKIWDEPLAFELLEKNTGNLQQTWYDFLSLLEDAADYNIGETIKRFKKFYYHVLPEIESKSNSMLEHHAKEYFEKLLDKDPEAMFDLGLETVRYTVHGTVQKINDQFDSIDIEDLHYDGVFDTFNFDREYASSVNQLLLSFTIDAAKKLALSGSSSFNLFLQSLQNENAFTLHKIALIALKEGVEKNVDETFTLIKLLYYKHGFDSPLQYFIAQLIKEAYPFFSRWQQEGLHEMILNLKSKTDFHIYQDKGKKKRYGRYGETKFEYLSLLPRNIIIANSTLKKVFQELERKFGKAEIKKPHGLRLQPVNSPLPASAYEHMTLEQWEANLLRIGADYEKKFFDGRGGLTENAREFEQKIKTNPAFFIPLIKKIIAENKVHEDYIIAALNGLKAADYSPEDFLELYKSIMKLPFTDSGKMRFIWLTAYINQHRLMDREVLDFLCFEALNNPNPEKRKEPEDEQYQSLNSTRGAAVHEIVRAWYREECTELIFTTLEKVAEDQVPGVKVSALLSMPLLLNIDFQKTLNLFLKFTSGNQTHSVYRFAINTAEYLATKYFQQLIPFLKNAITIEETQDEAAAILAEAWLQDKSGAGELLNQAWSLSHKSKAKMVDIAILYYKNENPAIKSKAAELYTKFLNDDTKEIAHEYSTSFLHLPPSQFERYYPLIKKFSVSKVAATDPHYYYDFLIKCSTRQPEKCIDLVENYKNYKQPDPINGPYYEGNEPIKIIIGSYNGLYDLGIQSKAYINKALDLFDEILLHPKLRSTAAEVLETV